LHIDNEIHELEQRIAQRRHTVEYLARAAKQRVIKTVLSPVGLLSAAGIGFLATLGLTRRHHAVAPKAVGKGGRIAGIASVLASLAIPLLRAQFGSPAHMAQLLLSKFQKYRQAAHSRPAAPGRPPAHIRP
jgi:hypothetical protein